MSLYDEGHTIAGWTGFGIATVGSAVAGWGVCAVSPTLIAGGLAVVVASVVVTWILHLSGWGKPPGGTAARAVGDAGAGRAGPGGAYRMRQLPARGAGAAAGRGAGRRDRSDSRRTDPPVPLSSERAFLERALLLSPVLAPEGFLPPWPSPRPPSRCPTHPLPSRVMAQVWKCSGLRWPAGGGPVLEWDGGRRSALPRGKRVAFAVPEGGVRRCVGARGHACAVRAVVPGRSTGARCEECARLDRAHSVAADTLADDPRPYRVYLAWFGPGLVKVGITAAERGRRGCWSRAPSVSAGSAPAR